MIKKIRKYISKKDFIKRFLLAIYFLYQDIASRLESKQSTLLILAYIQLRLRRLAKMDFSDSCNNGFSKVDLVIPTIGKDFILLEKYLEFIRINICEEIENIYIVAPKSDSNLIAFCQKNKLNFIDEETVLGYGKESISYTVNGRNRSGWLFQQLLKLSGDVIVKNKKYVIVDSDTILVNCHSFYENNKNVFFESTEWNAAYFKAFKKLFGYNAPNKLSLTSHMMIFDTDMLKEMKNEIELKHGIKWDAAYINSCIKNSPSGISDYDTYGQWMLKNYPQEVVTKPFYNKSFNRKDIEKVFKCIQKYRTKTRSISLHSYNS